uniref:Uncharacterized protein n=1 Tax=Sphaerodactylus townsendi TaxID=933632 RepID=A0ACB8FRK1_9SAUR
MKLYVVAAILIISCLCLKETESAPNPGIVDDIGNAMKENIDVFGQGVKDFGNVMKVPGKMFGNGIKVFVKPIKAFGDEIENRVKVNK